MGVCEVKKMSDFENKQDIIDSMAEKLMLNFRISPEKTYEVMESVLYPLKLLNCSEFPNNWIPCTPETMPRGSQIVLLTLPERIDDYGQEFCSSIICGHYIGGKDCEWGISDGSMIGYGLVSARYGVSPIAYMPLPAPYQPKEDES